MLFRGLFSRRPKPEPTDIAALVRESGYLRLRAAGITSEAHSAATQLDIAHLERLKTEQAAVVARMEEIAREIGAIR